VRGLLKIFVRKGGIGFLGDGRFSFGRSRRGPAARHPRLRLLYALLPLRHFVEATLELGECTLAVRMRSQARASPNKSGAAPDNQKAKPQTHEQESGSIGYRDQSSSPGANSRLVLTGRYLSTAGSGCQVINNTRDCAFMNICTFT